MLDLDIRGISYRQPWAAAIAAGVKPFENRARRIAKVGHWYALHVSQRPTGRGPRLSLDRTCAQVRELWPDCPEVIDLPFGVVIGVHRFDWLVELTGNTYATGLEARSVHEREALTSPWVTGPIVYHVDRFVPLPEPMPQRGALYPFELEPDVLAACRQAVLDSEGA